MTTAPHDRPRVFLEISVGAEPAGRLTIELFTDKAPRTCENFRQLCVGQHHGLSYATVPFHRVIDEFMVQGGDIERGDGTGTASIYGAEFEDENLDWREIDAAGLVCSANRGQHTNGSQFFITLDSTPHLNGKHTCFGALVAGHDTLQKISKVEVDKDDRPREPVLISRCGELERRQRRAAPLTDQQAAAASQDRGRSRPSHEPDGDVHAGKGRPVDLRRRRQSDNVVDEGLRGRPRQRSRSLSPSASRAVSSGSEGGSTSSAQRYKRKRSPSPSRHSDHGSQARWRRSLPNQYHDGRGQAQRSHQDKYRPSPRRDDYRQDSRRKADRYRPADQRGRFGSGRLGEDAGRLGDPSDFDDSTPPVTFKGRGTMKYREYDKAY